MRSINRLLMALALALAIACAVPAWAESDVEILSECVEEAVSEVTMDLGSGEEPHEFEQAPEEALPEIAEGVPETEFPSDIESIEARDAEPNNPIDDALMLRSGSATLGVGESLELLDKNWDSRNLPVFTMSQKGIVSVSKKGKVKALKKGNVEITVEWQGSVTSREIVVMSAPKAITLSPSSVVLGMDTQSDLVETFELDPVITENTASAITYSGYSGAVVSVEGNTVTPVGFGTTKITVKTFNSKKATVTVTVVPMPQAIWFDHDTIELCAGQTRILPVSADTELISGLSFESSDPDCVQVDGSGNATGLKEGSAQITARTLNGLASVCTVRVIPAPAKVGTAPTELVLGVGEISEIIDVWTDIGRVDGVVTLVSDNVKVARLTEEGAVKGVKKGSATITASAYNGVSASINVTVIAAPTKITLSHKQATLAYDAALDLGEQLPLTVTLSKNSASKIYYEGYDPSVIQVDGEGVVRAVGLGSTTLTVRTFNKKRATVAIDVIAAPERVSFTEDELTIASGDTCVLTPVFDVGVPMTPLSFESDNPDCAAVDSEGNLSAGAVGTATITGTAFNGVSGSCVIHVVPAPAWLEVMPKALELGVGESSQPLRATTDLGDDLKIALKYTNQKPTIASMDDDGAVKGLKAGTTTITVSVAGVRDTCKVTVKKAPSKVTISPKTLNLASGETAKLTATLPSGSCGAVTFESDDPNVVTVDEAGSVTAVGKGSANVTVTTYNGKTALCAVDVYAPAASITLPGSRTLMVRETIDCPIKIIDELGTAYTGRYEVGFDPKGIAEYADGMLKGLSAGETVMTVSAGNISKECYVIVERPAGPEIQSIAHRGSAYWPENTLEAFRKVKSTGCDGVELDAHSTKDGYQVIHHDKTFEVDGKTYTIANLTLAKIQKLDPSIPTLDEALDVLDASGLDIYLEMKENADGAKCVKAVKKHGLRDRTVYFSFFENTLKDVYAADPDATLGLSLKKTVVYNSSTLIRKIDKLHLSFFVAHKDMMTQKVTDYWHDLDMKICVYTPDTRSEVKKFINMGVEYILSDYPDYCVELR